MKMFKTGALVLALALPLAACVEETGGSSSGGSSAGGTSTSVNTLATRGNLSPDAIRLQTMSMRLLSLEQEQQAARDRSASFRAQGTGLGALAGALGGYALCELGDCSSAQRNRAMAVGAVGGGVAGNQMGAAQAQRQNNAASAENAMLRRLQISGQQLTTARQARAQAQKVVAQNQQKLTRLKADVAAGRASKAQLDLARADAAADAKQIRQTATVMDKSATTMKGEARLASNRSALTSEEQATQRSYDVLVKSIGNSAL